MVALILTLMTGLSLRAEVSSMDLVCPGTSVESCATKAVGALKKLGCAPRGDLVECHAYKNTPVCAVPSLCNEPHYGLRGQVMCWGDTPLDLRTVDRSLYIPVSVGFPRHWVRTICKSEP